MCLTLIGPQIRFGGGYIWIFLRTNGQPTNDTGGHVYVISHGQFSKQLYADFRRWDPVRTGLPLEADAYSPAIAAPSRWRRRCLQALSFLYSVNIAFGVTYRSFDTFLSSFCLNVFHTNYSSFRLCLSFCSHLRSSYMLGNFV